MLNKKILIVFLIFFLFLGFSTQALIVSSRVYFTDFSLEKANFAAGEEIRGNFALWNYEKEVVPDITYSYKLLAEDSDGLYTIVLDEKFSGDNFSLRPGQEVTKSFSYRLSRNLPSGSHKFRIQLFNSKGLPMSRKDSDITVQSDDKFLNLENHFLLKNGEKLSPLGTAVYDAGQLPKITFDISNNSSFQISASPRIALYYYNITESPLRVINQQSITLKPGELQNKTFDLVDFKESGRYVCRLAMYHNNEVISNSVYFSWEISGKEAEIAQVKLDDTSYQEGDEAEVTTDVVFKEEGGELQVTIYDEEGRIVGEKKEGIDSKGGRADIKVPITGDVVNPRVEIMAFDEYQKALDKYEAQVKDDEITEEEVPEKEVPEKDKGAYLMIGILILVLIFIIYFWRKGSSVTKAVFMVALVFSGIVFSGDSVLAGSEPIQEGSHGLGISQSDPRPEYIYQEDSYVQFSGDIYKVIGSPLLSDNNMKFFIGKPGEVATTTNPAYGNIGIIDIANSTVNELGELAPEYVNSQQRVLYDAALKIPDGLTFWGEIWFCTQFRGRDVLGNWHWLVYCEEATIQQKEEGCLYLDLDPNETEAEIGDEVNIKVKVDSKCPCVAFNLDVISVIDVSGSMEGQRIIDTKESAGTFVSMIATSSNQVGLVTYHTHSERRATLTFDYSLIEEKINDLQVPPPGGWPPNHGWTCISCGIETANREMASGRGRQTAVPYHILMTDGQANRCISGSCTPDGCNGTTCGNPQQDAINQAGLSVNAGITIYTIGFQVPAAAVPLMQTIADNTGGQYFHAPTGEKLKEVYETIAGLLLGKSPGTVLKIDIDPNYFTLIDIDPRCSYDGTTLTCNIGNLDCGGTIMDDFQFTLRLIDGESGDEIEIEATVENAAGKKKEDTSTITVAAPDPPTILPIIWDHCSFVFGELSVPTFRWETSVPHTGYNIEIYGATVDIWDKEVDLFAPSFFSSYAFIANPTDINWIRNNLLWGGTYDWRVKIKENGQWSDWSWGQVTMPDHSYPRPDFSHFPEDPPAGEIVAFTDKSKCYFSPGNVEHDCESLAGTEYAWDFDYNPPVFNVDSTQKGNVTTTFSQSRNYTVGLRITDNTLGNGYFGNNYCIGTGDSPVGVTFPLPEYREVAPIGRLDNFLARLINVFTGF